MEANLKYRIKYNVYCVHRNFFDKEIVIKNCMSKLHAKIKLREYLEKKYKKDGLENIRIFSCVEEEEDILKVYDDFLGTNSSKN